MSKIAELRKAINEAAVEIRKHADGYNERKKAGKDAWPDETKKAYDEANARYDKLAKELRDEEESASIEARMNKINEDQNKSTRNGRPMPGLDDVMPGEDRTYGDAGFDRDSARDFASLEKDKRNALRSYFLASFDDGERYITDEMRASCERLNFRADRKSLSIAPFDTDTFRRAQSIFRSQPRYKAEEEIRALGKGQSTAGADLVPTTFSGMVEYAMLATSPMLSYVDVMTTETGEPFQFPTVDDTAQSASIIAEAGNQNTDPTDPTVSKFTLNAYDYSTAFIKVSMQLMRDSIASVDLILARLIGERIARKLNTDFTLADGSSKPEGIVVGATNGKTTASATAITAGELIDLQHSVDPSYRINGTFMAHDSIIAVLRKLNDSQGRPLWSSGLADGMPDRLLGQPIIYNQSMASTVATTNRTMLYGDLSYYKVRRVGQVRIIRVNERFADTLQVGFLGYLAADGKLLKWSGSVPVKRLVQA